MPTFTPPMQDLQMLAHSGDAAAGQHRRTLDGICDKGLEALRRSAAGGFHDKQALSESLDSFQRMLTHDPQDPRPYAYLAYLAYLADSLDEAGDYLQQARRLQPDDADLERLAQLIESARTQIGFRSWRAQLPLAEQTIDLRELHHELWQLVPRQLQALSRLSAQEAAEFQLAPLDAFLEACQQAREILAERCADAEFETLMSPLRLRREQLAAQIWQHSLRQRLNQATQEADRLLKSFRRQQRAADLRPELEALYDTCDAIADELDLQAARGLDIAASEKAYERLLRFVTQLQQALTA